MQAEIEPQISYSTIRTLSIELIETYICFTL